MVLQCEDIINIYPFNGKEKLVKIFNSSDFAGMIVHDDVGELVELLEISEEQLMQELVYMAQQYAIPPISNFQVGAVVKGESGNFYFGANLEFPGETLAFTLHAEQAAIVNAMTHDERKITTIAVNYIPCCLCRQFMLELENAERLKIVLPDIVYSLLNIVSQIKSAGNLLYVVNPDINLEIVKKVD